MSWWCSALEEPWTWTPRPYLGVWILCGLFIGLYWWMAKQHRAANPDEPIPRRKLWQYAGGVFALWVASDWPVGTLGASYLSSVHMLQYMLYTLAAAPMLMLGTPEWMARKVVSTLRLEKVWFVLTRPVIAGVLANVVLIVTHAPFSVDPLRSSQLGSFVLDMIWLISGMIMWAPLINPIRGERMESPPLKIVYIFCAAALLPMIPGGFIAFSPQPLYSTYELAPRVWLSALHDQQFAGVLMKVGNVPLIWTVMAVIWFRWFDSDRHPRKGKAADAAASAGTGDEADSTDDRSDSSASGVDGAPPTAAMSRAQRRDQQRIAQVRATEARAARERDRSAAGVGSGIPDNHQG